MDLPVLIFLAGVVATLIVVASLAFTIYEVRRTNPDAFKPKSQDEPAPGS
jgi:hypothetical protein